MILYYLKYKFFKPHNGIHQTWRKRRIGGGGGGCIIKKLKKIAISLNDY